MANDWRSEGSKSSTLSIVLYSPRRLIKQAIHIQTKSNVISSAYSSITKVPFFPADIKNRNVSDFMKNPAVVILKETQMHSEGRLVLGAVRKRTATDCQSAVKSARWETTSSSPQGKAVDGNRWRGRERIRNKSWSRIRGTVCVRARENEREGKRDRHGSRTITGPG